VSGDGQANGQPTGLGSSGIDGSAEHRDKQNHGQHGLDDAVLQGRLRLAVGVRLLEPGKREPLLLEGELAPRGSSRGDEHHAAELAVLPGSRERHRRAFLISDQDDPIGVDVSPFAKPGDDGGDVLEDVPGSQVWHQIVVKATGVPTDIAAAVAQKDAHASTTPVIAAVHRRHAG